MLLVSLLLNRSSGCLHMKRGRRYGSFTPCHSNERGGKLVVQTLYLHSSLYVRHFALFIKVLEVSVDHVPAR